LASALKISPDWRTIYDDGVSVVFRTRRNPVSIASSSEGKERDRLITKTITSDRRFTRINDLNYSNRGEDN
jgi:hypothetical protein